MFNRSLLRKKKGFTLLELLIVVGILAILSAVVVLVINPLNAMQKARDSKRMKELQALDSALALFKNDNPGVSMGASNTVYISIPSALTNCSDLSLPPLPTGWLYACGTQANYLKTDGSGWIPINFGSISGGSPLSRIPIDPVNDTTYYYTYAIGIGYKVTALMENQPSHDIAISDGGSMSGVYEVGSDLNLEPKTRDMNLVGYWRFDEGSGITAYDSSGKGKTGTLTNGPTWITRKIGENALSFNGSNYVLTNSFSLSSPSNTLTFTFWAYSNSQTYYQTFISDGNQNNSVGFIFCYRNPSSTTIACQYGTGTSYSTMTVNSFLTGYDGQWVHIGIVTDYTNKWMKFYLNGALFGGAYTTSNTMLYPSTDRTKQIGCYGGWGHYLNGYIDDMRIYNRDLSASEIQAIYNATK